MAAHERTPRRPYIKPPPPQAQFTLFTKLPAEVRLKIWNLSMAPDTSTCIVPVLWSSTRRVLYSPRRPPVQLHISQESRYEALKIYQLRFASSPEFARTYFSFKNDILLLNWASLGHAPGRLGRKIGDDEVKYVRALMIMEEALLLHARDGMRDLDRFEGLRDLAVLCDSDNPQSGSMFGAHEIEAVDAVLNYEDEHEEENELVERKEVWPELICLRDMDCSAPCSRHWWFEWWNMRARSHQRIKWPSALAECLMLTIDGEEDTLMDWVDMFVAEND